MSALTLYLTSFPCQYRQKAGFAGLESGQRLPLAIRTRRNEMADGTTWQRLYEA